METFLDKVLAISLVIFMAGNLLETGLKVDLSQLGGALRNGRFLGLSLLWSFVLCPAVAWSLTKLIPLAEPYAIGLLFLGMAPCAPFLPTVAHRAGADLAYVAAFMILTAVGTVIYMPFAVPILVRGFSANPWMIAKPLILFIAVPLAIGVGIRLIAERFADNLHPLVRMLTAIVTILMILLILLLYGMDFISAMGSFAIVTQVLFYALVTAASYAMGFGLQPDQRSVLALGICTRNIGAAIAPLLSVAGTDQRSIAMCALAVPLTVICSMIAVRPMAKLCIVRRGTG